MFTSVNGVDSFIQHYLKRRDIRELKGPRLCAVGPSTTAALNRYGLRADVTPAEYRAEGILPALREHGPVAAKRFLLPRAQIAREVLIDELRAAGAYVADVDRLHDRRGRRGQRAGHLPDAARSRDRRGDVHERLHGSQLRADARDWNRRPTCSRSTVIATIGPVTAEAAQQFGLSPAVMPAQYTIPALVDALVAHFDAHPVSLATS